MKEERSSLEPLLSDLSRDQLQSLLLQLVEREPSLVSVIEGQVALFRPTRFITEKILRSLLRPALKLS